MKYLLLAVFFGLTSHCLALDDTPENRAKQADRYLEAVPPATMITDMTNNVVKTLPEAQRAQFTKIMTSALDVPALTAATRASLVKVFTADELKAQADYYGSPLGKSIVSKMGLYMAELMPVMQTQMQAAMQKAMAGSEK